MDNNINILLSMTDSLLDTTLEAYKLDNGPYYSHVYLEINKIINRIKVSTYSSVFILPELNQSAYYSGGTRNDLIIAISVLRQVRAFLYAATGEDSQRLEVLKKMNIQLKNEILDYKEREKDYLNIIKNSRIRSDYTIEEEKLSTFQGNNLQLINEALNSYSVGAYTACVCVCRNILQDIVQVACKENHISEGSLKAQIEKLIEKNIVKSENHSVLLDVAKVFGNRAAHPTTELFNKEKANLVLSALFIINEEVFKK